MYHIVFFMSPPRIMIWLWSSGRPLWQGAQQAQLRNITKEKSESKPVYQSIIVMYLYQLYPSREYIPYYHLFIIAYENIRKSKDCHKGKKIQPPIAQIVFLWLSLEFWEFAKTYKMHRLSVDNHIRPSLSLESVGELIERVRHLWNVKSKDLHSFINKKLKGRVWFGFTVHSFFLIPLEASRLTV